VQVWVYFENLLSLMNELSLKHVVSVDKLYAKLKRSAEALNKRLFVVMTAQTEGWAFARRVNFYESGV